MQTRTDLEDWYQSPDPWKYETTPDDAERKRRILAALPKTYKRALDIGCGEGWITKDLPATVIHGLELSDTARARIPEPVIPITEPNGMYDLITAMGVLYKQYDYEAMSKLIEKHALAGATILTCHIKDWEQPLPGTPIYTEEFPYREYVEVLKVYKW